MWPRMDFLDLQQLDRWPNGCFFTGTLMYSLLMCVNQMREGGESEQ